MGWDGRMGESGVCGTSKLSLKLGMKESVVGKYEKYHLFGMTGLLYIDDIPLGILRSIMLTLRPLRDTHRLVILLLLTPLDRLPSTSILTNPKENAFLRIKPCSVNYLPQNTVSRLVERKSLAGVLLVTLSAAHTRVRDIGKGSYRL